MLSGLGSLPLLCSGCASVLWHARTLDLSEGKTQTAVIDPDTGSATLTFTSTTLVVKVNPTFTIEGSTLSHDAAADPLVERAGAESSPELLSGMADALLVDPRADLGMTAAASVSSLQSSAAAGYIAPGPCTLTVIPLHIG